MDSEFSDQTFPFREPRTTISTSTTPSPHATSTPWITPGQTPDTTMTNDPDNELKPKTSGATPSEKTPIRKNKSTSKVEVLDPESDPTTDPTT